MSARSLACTGLIALASAGAFLASPANARAETPPSVWDRAKDDDAAHRYAVHVNAMIAIEAAALGKYADSEVGVQRAQRILESAHAEHSPDPLLRIDLGSIYERLQQNKQAVALLTSALAMAPMHVEAERAWNALAYAFARMDRPDSEIDAYEHYLALETDEESRASAVLNMAEAEMRRGNLRDAIVGYEDALRLAQDVRSGGGVQTYVLAIWGLAVAKDRNGDTTGAALEAQRAITHDPMLNLISDQKNVFFVPDYERFYYLGLGELALSAVADTARDRLDHMERAERRFTSYDRAALSDDRWLSRVRQHLAFAKKRRGELTGKP